MKKMNLKSWGLLSALILIIFPAMAGEGKPFTLKGKIKGADNKYIQLTYTSDSRVYKTDSALIKKGSFEFKGNLEHPIMAMLNIPTNGEARWDRKAVAQVFIEPGQLKIQLEMGAFDKAKLSGSKTQDEYESLKASQQADFDKLEPLGAEYNKLNEEYIAEMRAKKDSAVLEGLKTKMEGLRDDMEPFHENISASDEKFMLSHPDSYVSAYLFSSRVNRYPYEKGFAVYNSFSEPIKQSGYGKQALKELEEIKMGSPGSTAYVFTKNDINGEKLNLADYKGKYVLVDFWASWCVPCRKGNPHLKKLYNQYKNRGFEIIGISDDDGNHAAWKKAVDQDGIGIWKHVLRGFNMEKRMKNEKNPDDISDYYGISSLPTKILINKEGVIIGRYGSEEAELDAKLAEVMPAPTAVNLNGNIKGLKDSVVTINYYSGNQSKTDTVQVENEKFHWTAVLNEPQKIYIGTTQRYMQLFAENGDIQINGDMESFYYSKVTGSNSQDEYIKFSSSLEVLDSLAMIQYQALHAAKDDSRLKAGIENRIDSLRRLVNAEEIKYIVKNPSSPVSIDIVDNKAVMGEYKKVDSVYNLLSAEAKSTNAGKRIGERVEVLKRSAVGADIKDFTIPAMNGKKVKISDFRGKYLFIDFWASWCGPCRAENPNVLKAYNKYKGKNFTVLGISLDDKGDKWKEAVAKDKMPWTQVSDLKGFKTPVSEYYGIMGIPSTLLVDPNGKIIAKNLRGEQLQQKLAEILN